MNSKVTRAHINEHFQQMLDLITAGQYDDAYRLSEAILEVFPEADGVYHYQALLQNEAKQFKQAYGCQMMALKFAPDNATYHYTAAVYAANANDVLTAMLHYQRCLHIEPDHDQALWNYSEYLRLNGHIEMAIQCLHRLIDLGKADYPMFDSRLAACYSLAPTYRSQALPLFEKQLLNSDGKIGFWEYALELLKNEQFEQGFEYYNRRFERADLNNSYSYDFPFPLWDGQFKPNQTLLLHGEQGLGDEMMFASVIPELIAQAEMCGAKIIIACKAPLVRLFQHSFPSTQVIAHAYNKPALQIVNMPIDAQLPFGHLLQRNRKSMRDFDENRRVFLKADSARIAYYNDRIKIQGRQSIDGKRRFRVGLMWGTASKTHTETAFVSEIAPKSIPITLFAPFVDLLDKVEFISLQNHIQGHEAALVPVLKIVDFCNDQADFYDTAALVENCDLVISVCTSVSHLAGGLQAHTWVPLVTDPDWRHGYQRANSYWYNNTRYFHQRSRGNWYPTIVEMHDALRMLLNHHPA